MARNKIIFGVGAGGISLMVDGLSNLLILRLLTQALSITMTGYWMLVVSTGSLLLLLQFGMGPVIARAVAAASTQNDPTGMNTLLGAIRSAFLAIAAAVIVFAVIMYFSYLSPAAQRAGLQSASAMSWFPYSVGIAINLLGQAHLFILSGYGEVGWEKAFRTAFTTLGLIAAWICLEKGGGLFMLGTVYLAQNVLFWAAARWKSGDYLGPSTKPLSPRFSQIRELFKHGSKLLLLSVLTYSITQFTVFVVEKRFGFAEVTSYSAMLRVGGLIGAIGILVPQMLYPYVASSWAKGEFARCRRYYLLGVGLSVLVTIAICIPLLVEGREIFGLWLGTSVPFSSSSFIAVIAFYALYVFHVSNAMPVLAIVGNAFTVPALWNSAAVLLLVFTLPSSLGVVAIPIGMFIGTVPFTAFVAYRSWRILMSAGKSGNSSMPGYS